MNFDYSDVEKYAAELAAGAIEIDDFEDLEEADTAVELQLLAARVQAARHCGA